MLGTAMTRPKPAARGASWVGWSQRRSRSSPQPGSNPISGAGPGLNQFGGKMPALGLLAPQRAQWVSPCGARQQ